MVKETLADSVQAEKAGGLGCENDRLKVLVGRKEANYFASSRLRFHANSNPSPTYQILRHHLSCDLDRYYVI